jgi:hypothetical protein
MHGNSVLGTFCYADHSQWMKNKFKLEIKLKINSIYFYYQNMYMDSETINYY